MGSFSPAPPGSTSSSHAADGGGVEEVEGIKRGKITKLGNGKVKLTIAELRDGVRSRPDGLVFSNKGEQFYPLTNVPPELVNKVTRETEYVPPNPHFFDETADELFDPGLEARDIIKPQFANQINAQHGPHTTSTAYNGSSTYNRDDFMRRARTNIKILRQKDGVAGRNDAFESAEANDVTTIVSKGTAYKPLHPSHPFTRGRSGIDGVHVLKYDTNGVVKYSLNVSNPHEYTFSHQSKQFFPTKYYREWDDETWNKHMRSGGGEEGEGKNYMLNSSTIDPPIKTEDKFDELRARRAANTLKNDHNQALVTHRGREYARRVRGERGQGNDGDYARRLDRESVIINRVRRSGPSLNQTTPDPIRRLRERRALDRASLSHTRSLLGKRRNVENVGNGEGGPATIALDRINTLTENNQAKIARLDSQFNDRWREYTGHAMTGEVRDVIRRNPRLHPRNFTNNTEFTTAVTKEVNISRARAAVRRREAGGKTPRQIASNRLTKEKRIHHEGGGDVRQPQHLNTIDHSHPNLNRYALVERNRDPKPPSPSNTTITNRGQNDLAMRLGYQGEDRGTTRSTRFTITTKDYRTLLENASITRHAYASSPVEPPETDRNVHPLEEDLVSGVRLEDLDLGDGKISDLDFLGSVDPTQTATYASTKASRITRFTPSADSSSMDVEIITPVTAAHPPSSLVYSYPSHTYGTKYDFAHGGVESQPITTTVKNGLRWTRAPIARPGPGYRGKTLQELPPSSINTTGNTEAINAINTGTFEPSMMDLGLYGMDGVWGGSTAAAASSSITTPIDSATPPWNPIVKPEYLPEVQPISLEGVPLPEDHAASKVAMEEETSRAVNDVLEQWKAGEKRRLLKRAAVETLEWPVKKIKNMLSLDELVGPGTNEWLKDGVVSGAKKVGRALEGEAGGALGTGFLFLTPNIGKWAPIQQEAFTTAETGLESSLSYVDSSYHEGSYNPITNTDNGSGAAAGSAKFMSGIMGMMNGGVGGGGSGMQQNARRSGGGGGGRSFERGDDSTPPTIPYTRVNQNPQREQGVKNEFSRGFLKETPIDPALI